MLRACCGARYWLRWGSFSLATTISLLALSSDSADARRRKVSNYSPPYAAIVVDANTGAVMHATNPDALRHPASLTKIMTLYLLFERLEAGKLKLDTPLKVSDNAEDQPPTKLGLEEDQTIKVEEAIRGLITRSANDAAVVIAEALAGSEEEFAKLMTQKAHALGMTKTVYKNASGLPDSDQVTTAREQAILGRAIQERFPTYYKYFQTRSFAFRGQTISNHNRLLGRVEGVDGIKTGFTSASGFNLITSLRRDKRHVVAVVLGGSSAKIRDARMRQLLNQHVASASTKRTAPVIAEAPAAKSTPKGAQRTAASAATSQSDKDSQRFDLASASSMPAPQPITPGSTDPIRPVMVKTLNVKPSGPIQTASAATLPFVGLPRAPEPPPAAAKAEAPPSVAKVELPPSVVKVELPPPPPGARPGVLGTLPVRTAVAPAAVPATEPAPTAAPPPVAAPAVSRTAAAPPAAALPAAAPPKQPARTGWLIQVGAYPEEEVAKQRLDMVKGKADKLLAKADPFTETTVKDGTTYYRARFAVRDKDQAEAACKFLKRNDVDCMAIKN